MRADPGSAAADRVRRRKYFERRSRDAREGSHLPTLAELVRGMPFFRGDISLDAGLFAERVLTRIKSDSEEAALLRNGL